MLWVDSLRIFFRMRTGIQWIDCEGWELGGWCPLSELFFGPFSKQRIGVELRELNLLANSMVECGCDECTLSVRC
jgi:hypothetical protein